MMRAASEKQTTSILGGVFALICLLHTSTLVFAQELASSSVASASPKAKTAANVHEEDLSNTELMVLNKDQDVQEFHTDATSWHHIQKREKQDGQEIVMTIMNAWFRFRCRWTGSSA